MADAPAIVIECLSPVLDARRYGVTRALGHAVMIAADGIGERSVELHLMLASAGDNPASAPEAFTPHYRRGRNESRRTPLEGIAALIGEAAVTG